MSTFAGHVQRQGADDGWDGLFHSPTSIVKLPGGELIVADSGSHTLRLVELGGQPKNKMVSSILGATSGTKPLWDTDLQLRRCAEKTGRTLLGKLTTVAGQAGVQGCTDGGTSESLLASPSSLVLLSKCTVQSATVLFLQLGGCSEEPDGALLLRSLSVMRGKASGKPNDFGKLAFRVSTLHRFSEAPRLGPASMLELQPRELLLADGGALKLLKLDKSSEPHQVTPSDVVDGAGRSIALRGGDVSLGMCMSGVVIIAHNTPGSSALYRLLAPSLWKKADRKCDSLRPLRTL